jgi:hypothetical protein
VVYLCECHKERAEKPPLRAQTNWKDRDDGKWSKVGLGKWRCLVTLSPCFVRPAKAR